MRRGWSSKPSVPSVALLANEGNRGANIRNSNAALGVSDDFQCFHRMPSIRRESMFGMRLVVVIEIVRHLSRVHEIHPTNGGDMPIHEKKILAIIVAISGRRAGVLRQARLAEGYNVAGEL